jgi:hypothetical protein
MIALQDEGKPSFNKKGEQLKLLEYNHLKKLSRKIHNLLAQRKTDGLHQNMTRGTDRIVSIISTLRKRVDKSSVHEQLRKYSKTKDNMMLLIENNVQHAGYPLILARITEYLKSNIISSKASRTSNDALRVCGILLHDHYRDAVTVVMRNKKDRKACDLSHDPTIALCEQAVKDFNEPNFIIIEPSNAHELKGYNTMDPNDPDRIKLERDGPWFWDTWKFVRSKYRACLTRWSRTTGNGNTNFQNYCNGDKWVAWVYMLDKDGLLSGNAGTAVPAAISNEPGCDDDDDDGNKKPASKRKKSLLSLEESTSHRQNHVSQSADKMVDIVNDLVATVKKRQQNDVLSPKAKAQKEIVALNERQALILNDDCYSPDTKERVKNECGMKKREWVRTLTGEYDIIKTVLPFNNAASCDDVDDVDDVPMHQSGVFDNFKPDSDDEA